VAIICSLKTEYRKIILIERSKEREITRHPRKNKSPLSKDEGEKSSNATLGMKDTSRNEQAFAGIIRRSTTCFMIIASQMIRQWFTVP
jgi:hypothetical protein